MGCASSKLDDLPAVALCRHRCTHLDDAVRHRYALAEAHMAYITTLKSIARSMHDFLDPNFDPTPLSPVLNLPNQRKGDPIDPGQARLSHSDSGSHLHLHSDDDSDDSGSGHLHDSGHSSPLHSPTHHIEYMNLPQNQDQGPFQGGFLHMNYMQKRATPPTVVYEQRPMSYETVQYGESSSSSSYYPPYPYSTPNQAAPYPYYGYGGAGGGGYGGDPPAAPQNYPYLSSPAVPPPSKPSPSPPPSPPPPPENSGWDFLNFFETSYDDKYYTQYTPSRDSRDVREEEGIPDLEDEEFQFQHEVVKQVHGHSKFVETKSYSKSVAASDEEANGGGGGGRGGGEAPINRKRPSTVPEENSEVEYEVHVVDKKVVGGGDEPRASNATGSNVFRGANEVVRQIELQFERASESGNEIATMLEVGKFQYRRKHPVASKMVQAVTPPLSISSKASTSTTTSTSTGPEPSSASEASGPSYMEGEVGMRSGNLSSTLHKLYLWEKKLYSEVKAEEKMRVIHDRKVEKLKRLDQRGAEATKVDAARTLIRSLSTKIRMAIQVVDRISITINKIRDEELWPQLNELLQGLTRMWKCMLECHRIQCQAIGTARGLGPIRSGGKMVSDAHLEATLQFEGALINWTFRFASWISAQKGFVKSLNEWLLKCLLYEPEETADGIVPFSPGRIGAPPIFVICNQWAQSLDRISEKEVLDAMREFVTGILQMWRQDKSEMRERMVADKDLEKKVKVLDKKDYKIQKEVQALEKKVVLFTGVNDEEGLSLGQVVYPGDASRNLQSSLQKIFVAMEKFMDSSSKAYEELLQRCEEEQRIDRERSRAS